MPLCFVFLVFFDVKHSSSRKCHHQTKKRMFSIEKHREKFILICRNIHSLPEGHKNVL